MTYLWFQCPVCDRILWETDSQLEDTEDGFASKAPICKQDRCCMKVVGVEAE